MIFGVIKYLLHECFENTKFIPPGRIKFLSGDPFWKYDISNGNNSFHFPHHHWITEQYWYEMLIILKCCIQILIIHVTVKKKENIPQIYVR